MGGVFNLNDRSHMDKIIKETSQELLYRRKSIADEIPDNFAERVLGTKFAEKRSVEREVCHPKGYTVTIAYNKSGYQLIPAKDLK